MNPIFKPTPLSWEDIEGGLGEVEQEAINDFVCEYCQTEEPVKWAGDDELENDLTFFAEAWERVAGNGWGSAEISTPQQTAAVLSLICGAFYHSMARDKIVEALVRSATKPQLVEIVTHVSAAFCQYIAIKARVEIARARQQMEEEP